MIDPTLVQHRRVQVGQVVDCS